MVEGEVVAPESSCHVWSGALCEESLQLWLPALRAFVSITVPHVDFEIRHMDKSHYPVNAVGVEGNDDHPFL